MQSGKARSPRRGRTVLKARVRAQAGFSLMEVLVALVIIGLVVGIVGPRVLSSLSDARVRTAKLQIESLSSALDLYFIDMGRYPTAEEGLEALMRRPANAEIWNGPYLKGSALPRDPWGQTYLYRVPGRGAPYELVSYGSDGREGGEGNASDISSVK